MGVQHGAEFLDFAANAGSPLACRICIADSTCQVCNHVQSQFHRDLGMQWIIASAGAARIPDIKYAHTTHNSTQNQPSLLGPTYTRI